MKFRTTHYLMSIAMALTVALPSLAVAGSAPFECKSVHWPYPELKQTRERARTFRKIDRNQLVEYYFTELSEPKDVSLVRDLGAYLEGTEQDELMQGYLQIVADSAVNDDGSTRALPHSELCDNYVKTLRKLGRIAQTGKNSARKPASSKR